MDEINEIVETLNKWRDAYYNGQPVVTDAEFDDLEDKLRELDPENEYFQGIGEDEEDGFPKAKHLILMGSQDKCNTIEEIIKKLNHFKGRKVEFLVEPKCDGLSLEMNYLNGKPTVHITRGDGYVGDDITANASKMMGVPAGIPVPDGIAFRGEIMLLHSDKEKYFPDLKNCRNGASGTAKNKEGIGCEHLTVVTYDCQYTDEDKSFGTEADKLEFLNECGFMRVNADMVVADCTTPEGIKKAAEDLMDKMNEFTNTDREYDTDGVVVKLNVIDEHDLRTNLHPTSQFAIKPKAIHKQSPLRDIEWNMVNGSLTPVAIFDPIVIDGATIRRATLVNVRYIEELQLEIGDTLDIIRANMVIPRILGNVSKNIHIVA